MTTALPILRAARALCLAAVVSGILGGCARQPEKGRPADAAKEAILTRESPPVVILAPNAAPAERYAAEELSAALGKMLQVPVEIRTSGDAPPSGSLPIYVGRHPRNARLAADQLDVEESVVDIQPDAIHLAGGWSKETRSGGEPPLHDRGTLYAVYDFLESLGVRWFRPEDWGEYIPRQDRIVLTPERRVSKPVYKYRYGINHYQTYTPFEDQVSDPVEKEAVAQEREMARRWAVRNRMNTNLRAAPKYGGFYEVDFSHSYRRYLPPEKYFAKHPEYYALINGKRSSDPNAQLCLGNPEVQDKVFEGVLKAFEKRPHLSIASLDPNDYALWCECDLCRAMDDPALKADHASSAMPEKIRGISMANRVALFGNEIARRLAKALPDKRVGWYAYHSHTEVPTRVSHFEPNVSVMPVAFAGSFSDYSRGLYDPKSPQNARFLKILEGYAALSRQNHAEFFAHDYWSFYVWPGPLPVLASMTDKLRHYHKDFGVVGVYSETHPCWGPQGMTNYFYTWLLRNPEGDLEKEKDVYYRGYYGPAAEPMRAYHEILERSAWEGGVYFGSGGSSIEPLFTKDLLGKTGELLERAAALAQGHAPYEGRLQTVAAGHAYAQKVRHLLDLTDASRPREALAAVKDLEEFFNSFPDGSVFDNRTSRRGSFKNIFDNYRKKIGKDGAALQFFENPVVAQSLQKGWRFRPDPENSGERNRWHDKANDADWTLLAAGQPWQSQGFSDYHGAAWYRKTFKPPTVREGKRLMLFFGAVDGDATVYLNGEKLGERLLEPGTGAGYDKPFFFDVTDLLDKSATNQLAVRVKKDRFVGGLTGEAQLLETDGLRPPE